MAPAPASPPIRRGFTLIELLVVVAIIGVLVGMLMPVLGLVRRSANRANTENLLRKVETGLTAFRRDVRSFPYFVPTFAAGDGAWTNDLGRRLARDMTTDERDDLRDDLDAIKAAYAMGIPPATNGSCYITPDMIRIETNQGNLQDPNIDGIRGALSRALVERATVAVMAGNTGIQRTVAPAVAWGDWIKAAAVLSAPKSRGFGADYFGGEMQSRDLIEVFDATANANLAEGLKDAFGTPLLYLNPSVNGIVNHTIQFTFADEGNSQRYPGATIDPVRYGLRATGRTATLTLASDIRTTALEQHRFSYEAWSAGPDRRFAPLRNDLVNRDNLSTVRYAKGLQ
jgi:prepilin-type N-terminal cleavage/methylation domain-containing protein